jgi:hypothetical protein
VQDHKRSTASSLRLHCYAGAVDGNQLTLYDCFRVTTSVANVDPLAIETLVVLVTAKRTLRPRRRNLQVVRAIDEIRVVDQRPSDPAYAFAVCDGDRLAVIDRDSQSPTRLARLLERVQLIAHVFERGLEQLFD